MYFRATVYQTKQVFIWDQFNPKWKCDLLVNIVNTRVYSIMNIDFKKTIAILIKRAL